MAVAFRAVGAATGAGVTRTPALPTGWQTGDIFLLVATAHSPFGQASISVDGGGWTLIVATNTSSFGMNGQTALFYRRAQAGDAAPTVRVSAPASIDFAQISAWSGALSSGTPYDVASTAWTVASNSKTLTLSAITTTVDGDLLIALCIDNYSYMGTPGDTWTWTSPLTERWNTNLASPASESGGADTVQASAGSTGNIVITAANGTYNMGILIALKAEASSTTTPAPTPSASPSASPSPSPSPSLSPSASPSPSPSPAPTTPPRPEVYDETGRAVIVPAAISETDAQVCSEIGRAVLVAALTGETDSSAVAELGREILVAANVGETDAQVCSEIGRAAIVATVIGETDSAALSEIARVIVAAHIGESDAQICSEIGRAVIIAVLIGETDARTFGEIGRAVIIAARIGGTDSQVCYEIGRAILVSAETGEADWLRHVVAELEAEWRDRAALDGEFVGRAELAAEYVDSISLEGEM